MISVAFFFNIRGEPADPHPFLHELGGARGGCEHEPSVEGGTRGQLCEERR